MAKEIEILGIQEIGAECYEEMQHHNYLCPHDPGNKQLLAPDEMRACPDCPGYSVCQMLEPDWEKELEHEAEQRRIEIEG